MHLFRFLIPVTLIAFLIGQANAQEYGDEMDIQVYKLLQNKCAMCHDDLGEDSAGADIDYILRFDRMVEDGYVDSEDPESSVILDIVPDDMPKERMKKIKWNGALSKKELELFQKWVKRGGPSEKYLQEIKQASQARPTIELQTLVTTIVEDLNKRRGNNLANVRYLTITNLHNDPAISEERLELYRAAVVKALNSLSLESDIVIPEPIDEAKTIYRFDLRDIGWNAEKWELVAQHYPYEIEQRGGFARTLYGSTSSQLPYLRADWFVFAATQPPLYHELVSIPKNLEDLEDRLFGRKNARFENIRNSKVIRAGFGDSGVSVNNRLVERHVISTGAYWISYDFASNDGKQNLMDFPLGPKGVWERTKLAEFEKFTFDHDGGEVIFNLPNGFQAYGLFDAKGNRINVGPSNIVHDDTMAGGAIINGVSCISCHDKGMKPEIFAQLTKLDRVRGLAENNFRRFNEETRDQIKEIYPEGKDFAKLIREDRKRFETAMEKAGLSSTGEEPVRALFNQFISDLKLETVAAGLYMDVEALRERLNGEGETRQILMRLEDEGVKRQLYLQDFKKIIELSLGRSTRKFKPLKFPFFGENPDEVKVERDVENSNTAVDTPKINRGTGVRLIDEDHFGGELKVKLETTGRRKHYKENEVMQCEITANKDCFVSVFSVDPKGDMTMLVPNKWHPKGLQIKAGAKTKFPTPQMGFEFYITPPHGSTLIKAIATTKPLAIAGVTDRNLEKDGIVSLGNTKSIGTKGVGVRQANSSNTNRSAPVARIDLSRDTPDNVLKTNQWGTARWTVITGK